MEESFGNVACTSQHGRGNKYMLASSSEDSVSEYGSWVDIPETVFTDEEGGHRRLEEVDRFLNSKGAKDHIAFDGTIGSSRSAQAAPLASLQKVNGTPKALEPEGGCQEKKFNKRNSKSKNGQPSNGSFPSEARVLSSKALMPKSQVGQGAAGGSGMLAGKGRKSKKKKK